jgi:hypothetical protein
MIEIILNGTKPRDEERQIAYITVSGADSQVYKFQVGNVPAALTTDQQVQDHLDARKDELHLFCLRKTYVGVDCSEFKTEGKTELQCFLDWIDAGAENPDGEVIANHTYAGTHPLRYPPAEDILQEALDLLADFSDTTFQELADRIEEDVTTPGKTNEYLVELSKAFLALIRFVDHNAH